MGDGKRYKDILHTTENANIREITIKLKFQIIFYIFKLMVLLFLCEKIKKELKRKYFFSTMHIGIDEEKSTKTRKVIKKKKGIFQMMDKNTNKNEKSSFNNFIDKIFKLMDTYDINENTIILVLSDGEKQIKKIYKAIETKYKNNTV